MVAPRRVIRDPVNGAMNRWNAFIELLSSSFDGSELTAVQRTAFYMNRYVDEVWNGGHAQYFANCDHLDHAQVERALADMGADCLARVFASARIRFSESGLAAPPTDSGVDAYLAFDEQLDLRDLDAEAFACQPSVTAIQSIYLDAHEAEFIEWVD
jgi:hypothetical protein